MPGNPRSSSSRAVGTLFATGILIVFAGLAGLGATAISVATASGEDEAAQPAWHPARSKEKYAYADSSGRILILRRFAWADTVMRNGEGWIFDAAPLAESDVDSR